MATVVSRIPLSGSTHGRPIKVTGTSSGAGTAIHTGNSSTTNVDVVTLYAYNSSSSAVTLSIGWGETVSPDDIITLSIPAQSGLTLVVPDMVIRNSLAITAWAGTANVVMITGFANRVTTT